MTDTGCGMLPGAADDQSGREDEMLRLALTMLVAVLLTTRATGAQAQTPQQWVEWGASGSTRADAWAPTVGS